MLLIRCQGDELGPGGRAHVFDFASKALPLITRSTFSAGLLGACDPFDLGFRTLHTLNEITHGVPPTLDMRALRKKGGFVVPAVSCMNSLSVFAAASAACIKPPTEKGLLAHLQYPRELLDLHVLHALMWMDTRDMTADALTKETVERLASHLLMTGELEIKHEPKVWKSLC